MSERIIRVRKDQYRAWWEKEVVDDDHVEEYQTNEENELIVNNNSSTKKDFNRQTTTNKPKYMAGLLYHKEASKNLSAKATKLVSQDSQLKEFKTDINFEQSPISAKCDEYVLKSQESKPRVKVTQEKYQVTKNHSQTHREDYILANYFNDNSNQNDILQKQSVNDNKHSKELILCPKKSKIYQCRKQRMKYRTQMSGDRYKEVLKILYGVEKSSQAIGNENLDIDFCTKSEIKIQTSNKFNLVSSFTSVPGMKRLKPKNKRKNGLKNNCISSDMCKLDKAFPRNILKYSQQHFFRKQHDILYNSNLSCFEAHKKNSRLLKITDKQSNSENFGAQCRKILSYMQCPLCVVHSSSAPNSCSDKEYEDSNSSVPVSEKSSMRSVHGSKTDNYPLNSCSKDTKLLTSEVKHLDSEAGCFCKILTEKVSCSELSTLERHINIAFENSEHQKTPISLKDTGTNTSPSLDYCVANAERDSGQVSAKIKNVFPLTVNKTAISSNDVGGKISQRIPQQISTGKIFELNVSNSSNTTESLSSCTELEIVSPSNPSGNNKHNQIETRLPNEVHEVDTRTKNPSHQTESNSSSSHTSGTYNLSRKTSHRNNQHLKLSDSIDSNASISSNAPKNGSSCTEAEATVSSDLSENSGTYQTKSKSCEIACKTTSRKPVGVETIGNDQIGILAKEKLINFNSGSTMSKMLYDSSSVIQLEHERAFYGDKGLPIQDEEKRNTKKPLVHDIVYGIHDLKAAAKQKLVNFNSGSEMTHTLYGPTYLRENSNSQDQPAQRNISRCMQGSDSDNFIKSGSNSKENLDQTMPSAVYGEMVTIKPSFESNGNNCNSRYFVTEPIEFMTDKNQNECSPFEQTSSQREISAADFGKIDTSLMSDRKYITNKVSNSFQVGNNVFQNPIPYVCYPVSIRIIGAPTLRPNFCNNNANITEFISKNVGISHETPKSIEKPFGALYYSEKNNHEDYVSRPVLESAESSESRHDIIYANNKVNSPKDFNSNANICEYSISAASELNKTLALQAEGKTSDTRECNSNIIEPPCPTILAKKIAHESLSGKNVASILYGGCEGQRKPDNPNTKYTTVNRESYKWSKSECASKTKNDDSPASTQHRSGNFAPNNFQAPKDKIAERNISNRKPKGIVPGLEEITD